MLNSATIGFFFRENPTDHEVIEANSASLGNSNFNTNNPTKIFVHGFFDDASIVTRYAMVEKWLFVGDYNIISIDWSTLAVCCNYFSAADSVIPVGEYSANLIQVTITTIKQRNVFFNHFGF